jgi:hypothetical protein
MRNAVIYWWRVASTSFVLAAELVGWGHPKRWVISIPIFLVTTVLFYLATGNREEDGRVDSRPICPICKGQGRVAIETPYGRLDESTGKREPLMELAECPRCKGTGRLAPEPNPE